MEELLLKFADNSILLAFLFGAAWFLRPLGQKLLEQMQKRDEQQAEQMKLQTQQLERIGDLVGELKEQQTIFSQRLEHVEDLVGVVAAERRASPSSASVNSPTRRR